MIPTTGDRETFLLRLRQSGLLTGTQCREAAQELGAGSEAVALARSLVRRGLLTRFQARMLLHGKTDGFFVGPYRILEQVGKGGMGRVYKAVHQTLNRTVALKILAPRLVRTAKARALFRNEAQTAARLNHPGIVQAYDAGESHGLWYLAMEFVGGVTLSQLVHQRGPLPVGLACEVVRQTALALQHAHEHGLVHRDIKPANLMISVVRGPAPAGGVPAAAVQIKILDFGLARLQRRSRPRTADPEAGRHPITGTPDFMSPEQARDRDAVDIRSDLYSLGCTFYYLLTGRVPFAGGGMLDKLIRHSSELPTPPDEVRPRVPATVGAIVLRLMAKEAGDRFQTPQEVADAVAPFAAIPDLSRPGMPRRADAAAEPTAPGDKTLGPDDTSPQVSLPTEPSAEQEAIAAWIADQLGERRQRRRRFGWLTLAASLATAAAGALAWWQPWM